jgi:micrococcal nuclease
MSARVLSRCMSRWRALPVAFLTCWLLVPLLGYAEQFTGKVVGISDGDTLSVLREGKAVKVRLHGIDTPEKAQAFGTQARTFTSDAAFQQAGQTPQDGGG